MLMRSASHHVLVVACSVFHPGSLCSPREVPQNAQSQEQATRKTIDSFNEAFS
jgi:hypothetical protein